MVSYLPTPRLIFTTIRNTMFTLLFILYVATFYTMTHQHFPPGSNHAQAGMMEMMIIMFVLIPITIISIIISCIVSCLFKSDVDVSDKYKDNPNGEIYTNGFTFPHFNHNFVNKKNLSVKYFSCEEPTDKEPIDWKNLCEHHDREIIELKNKIKRLEYSLDIANNAYNELQKYN